MKETSLSPHTGSEPFTLRQCSKTVTLFWLGGGFRPLAWQKRRHLATAHAWIARRWGGASPFAAERARRGEPAPSSPAEEARWALLGIRHDPRLRDRISRRIGEPAEADRRMPGFANAGAGVRG